MIFVAYFNKLHIDIINNDYFKFIISAILSSKFFLNDNIFKSSLVYSFIKVIK